MISNTLVSNLGKVFEGPLLIKPEVFSDSRGFFMESWNQKSFNNLFSDPINFVQDNHSFSFKSVLRGLHYQLNPHAQAKLVRCVSGEIFDVLVDLRLKSSTFGEWTGVDLSAENFNQLWVPIGFAHGFLTKSESAVVLYKTTEFWYKELDRSLNWPGASQKTSRHVYRHRKP